MLFFSRWKAVAVLLTAFFVGLLAVPNDDAFAGTLPVPGLRTPKPPINLIAQSARIEFRLVDQSMSAEQALQTRPPAGSEMLYGTTDKLAYLIEKRVILSSEDMCDAQPGFDQRTNEPVVYFRFNRAGAQRFAQATQENVGHAFAIVLDDEVISAPVIREPILGGSGQISGRFTVVQANDLALQIRAAAITKC
jgi:protein-export membrane protein SecD